MRCKQVNRAKKNAESKSAKIVRKSLLKQLALVLCCAYFRGQCLRLLWPPWHLDYGNFIARPAAFQSRLGLIFRAPRMMRVRLTSLKGRVLSTKQIHLHRVTIGRTP